MRLQNMLTGVKTPEGCPICSALIKVAEVEPHPERDELEIHGFSCVFCGPVMSVVVRRPVEEDLPLLTLM